MQQQQLHLRASPPLKCHFPLPAHLLSFFFSSTHCLASSFPFLWNNVSFHLSLSPIPPHLDLGRPRCTYPHIDTQIQCKTYQNPSKNFCRYIEKINLHFVQKGKRIGITKTMRKKRKNVEEIILPKFKTLQLQRLFATPWTVTYQAPLSMGFPTQEYWIGKYISFSRGSS